VEERRRFLEERFLELEKCAGGKPGARVSDVCMGIEYYAASLEEEGERRALFGRLAYGMFEAGQRREAAILLAEFEAPTAAPEALYESAGFRALGDRLRDKGELTRAIETYTEALKKDPGNIEARIGLGLSFTLSRDYTRAGEELDKAANRPGLAKGLLAWVLVGRGLSKAGLDDNQGAITDFTAAVEMPEAPADLVALALAFRGRSKERLGDNQGAIADLTAVVEMPGAPADLVAKARLHRGIKFSEEGNHTKALEDFELCMESKTDIDILYRAFALLIGVYLQDGRLQDAVNRMARLHEMEPDGVSIERCLEARLAAIVDAGRGYSLDAASALLEASMQHDPEKIRDRIAFLKPAIEFAKTGSEDVFSSLPDKERDAARQISAALVKKKT
jgi:tetratricopeptide (TPR) repeat protein